MIMQIFSNKLERDYNNYDLKAFPMKAKSFIQKREGTKENLGGGEKICMKFSSISVS